MSTPYPTPVSQPWQVVLTGNPNCGKTTLFNALTGLRAKVGNYAGVTVERKEARMLGVSGARSVTVLDLPGTYSLSPQSPDEKIARDVLLEHLPEVPSPDLVVVVLDASNLERNLYYATQVIDLGHPTVLVLNMLDVAHENGLQIDLAALAQKLGVPTLALVASRGEGIQDLKTEILKSLTGTRIKAPDNATLAQLPLPLHRAVLTLADSMGITESRTLHRRQAEALLLLSDERSTLPSSDPASPKLADFITSAREQFEAAKIDWRTIAIEARYTVVSQIFQSCAVDTHAGRETLSDRIDRVLTHKFWGILIFLAIMTAMFQTIFTLAEYPKAWVETVVSSVGLWVGQLVPPGDLHSLLVDGVVAGVGSVVIFLPQICLLFLFIGLLEDTGYMARAAFLMDRLMSKVGLHGKSFIPMLSSFACAIPGIMATRTIESVKDRLVTILVAPLMSCSARLPVYTLLIGACIPNKTVLGILKLSALTMLSMYLLGTLVALIMAWIFKKTLLRGEPPMLIMELPPYKRPVTKVVLRHMWERARLFLQRAGTVILGISILLWFLSTYPRQPEILKDFAARKAQAVQQWNTSPTKDSAHETAHNLALAELDNLEAGEKLRHSFAGKLGHLIEPIIAPLGFDWKIGIGIIASFAAREVFVSTMSTVYNVGAGALASETNQTLTDTLKNEKRSDGTQIYSPLLGITLMVFYVFALQCVSTVAVVRRETNSWKWPIFQWVYMGTLAWVLAFLTFQGGKLLGFQ